MAKIIKQKCFTAFFLICLTLALQSCVIGNAAARTQPDWIRDPYTTYDRQVYFAVVGIGSSRDTAEKNALGNLVALFGQNIRIDENATTIYQEAATNGITTRWSENTEFVSMVSRSASFNSLVGAEIGEVWNDDKNNFYAAAILNQHRAVQIYPSLIRSNQRIIDNLLNLPASEKNTFDGLARYEIAATVADITIPYVYMLSVLGMPSQEFKKGDTYRLDALNIVKAIPVNLRVQNDISGRIQGAFAKALSDFGFQSGGNNSRYTLDVNIINTPLEFANSPYKWTRFVVNADLVDTSLNTVLLPYSFNLREGHNNQAEADNRALASAVQKINDEYADLLSGYLSRLLPQN